MNLFERKRIADSDASKYASEEDIRNVLLDDIDMFFQLSYLLTGDSETAQQCIIASLDESVRTNQVFKEWAHIWAKRIIIQNAIRALKPRPGENDFSFVFGHAAQTSDLCIIPDPDLAVSIILGLGDFERFVFVIAVLEGHSEHECALLLDASVRDVRNARIRATEQFAAAASNPIGTAHS